MSRSQDTPTRPLVERRRWCRCSTGDVVPGDDGTCRVCRLRLRPPSNEAAVAVDADLAVLSDTGHRYSRLGLGDQDAVSAARLADGTALLVVADGVSNSNAAAAASAAAVAAVGAEMARADGVEPAAALRRAIAAAQAAVLAVPVPEPDPAKDAPESTIAAALIRAGRAVIGWIGDSRAYLVSGDTARLLTRDDSWLAETVEAGTMSLEAA